MVVTKPDEPTKNIGDLEDEESDRGHGESSMSHIVYDLITICLGVR